MPIKHTFTSTKDDGADATLVRPSNWNADHTGEYVHPNHSGDVTSVADGAQTITANAVTNAKAAQMATKTYKGRTSAGTGNPEDVPINTLKANLGLWTRVLLTNDVTNNNATANTLADVTGMVFNVVSERTYWVKFYIWYTAAANTTGSRWTLVTPNCVRLSFSSNYSLTITTQTLNARVTADATPAASSASSADAVANKNTAGGHLIMEGVLVPSANGTCQLQFASEVSNSAVVAKVGSFLEYLEIA